MTDNNELLSEFVFTEDDDCDVGRSSTERRSAVPPPPPPGSRRMPLRRMPTELVLTTRMPPVRQTGPVPKKRASGVFTRSQAAPAAPVTGPQPPTGAGSQPWVSPEDIAHKHGAPDGRERPVDPSLAALVQAQRQLAIAIEHARRSAERANAAEQRAMWAEQFVPRYRAPTFEHAGWLHAQRVSLLKGVLLASLIGLAIGGYLSLLLPVRERVMSQAEQIRELSQAQEQLREENTALKQRLGGVNRGAAAEHPPNNGEQ